jgi:diguanylate cyclase (GGDEF)-like protein
LPSKNKLASVFVALFWCAAAWASPRPLTTLLAIRALTPEQVSQNPPVSFEATVSYYDNLGVDLFVQDGDKAIYVVAYPGLHLVPGDRVLIKGTIHQDFRPDVGEAHITLLHHGPPPPPIPATFSRLIRAELDCLRVSVKARVRSADIFHDGNETGIYLNLLVDGGYVEASVSSNDSSVLSQLLDADVEITGAAAGKFDSKMQLTGILIEIPSLADIKILKHAAATPESLPITPMDEILQGYSIYDHSQRIRTRGTITYYEPGIAAVLQNGSRSLWVMTQYEGPLRVGQVVDATGFPDARNGYLTLTHSEFHPTTEHALVIPQSADWAQLAPGKHAFDLVSTQGRVLAVVRGAVQDEYVLTSGGHVFSALFRHPDTSDPAKTVPLPPVKNLTVGSLVRVTGICTLEHGSDPLGVPVAFNILLRSLGDIQILARPSPLNIRNLILLLGLLLLAVIAAAARGWILERQLRRQTSALAERIESEAALERRRSRILEDINAGRPLLEILEQITALVSYGLTDSPCWCQTASGAFLGKRPANLDALNVIRQEIVSRSGPPHGQIFVALQPAAPAGGASEALSIGAWLTALAIETHGLYADLRRRSEFDLLTEIHNRFSFEKRLEAAVEEAHANHATFGLIYVDLDEFKQVNDSYGHRAGDCYLQQAAQRMKHQLRPGDMLARLGGDEFGILVHSVGSRTELEEIARRIGRCFESPFAIDGYQLCGSASLGAAIFPEDGDTKDTLLSAADAAMYVAKHTRKSTTDMGARTPR